MRKLPSLHTTRLVLTWLCHAARNYRIQMILNVLVGVLHVGLLLLTVWFSKQLIDQATSGSFSVALALFLAATMLLDVGCVYATRWTRALLGVRSENQLRAKLYDGLLRADYRFLSSEHSGGLTSRLTKDVTTVSNFLSEQVPNLLTSLLQFAGAFVFLFLMEWRLAIVIIVVVPVFVLVAQIYIRKMRRFTHDVREQEADIQSFVQETVQHSLMVKALDRIAFVNQNLGARQQQYKQLMVRNTRYGATALLIVNLSFVAGYLIAFFWGAYRLSAGAITFGAMIAFVQLVGQIQGPIRTLANYVSVFVQAFTATDRLMAIQSPPADSVIPQQPVSTASDALSIVVSDLSFAYSPENPVLTHFSATFPAGSRTAIVGKTGIGKTTLISLLLGLLRPDEGTISIVADGQEWPAATRFFAFVPQGNSLLSGTIRDNLRYGRPDATDDEMMAVLEIADAQFVKDSKEGLDMNCGERGLGLSEGQAQRVAIARALLQKAPVLLLDEAFSALDNDTALRVMQRIEQQGHTLLYVTHRESLLPLSTQTITLS